MTRNVDVTGNWEDTKSIMFNSILAPSTSYTGKNPSFAVYEIDEETMLILNVTTYYFNISKANNGEPEWEVYHNILEAYGIEDISPKSIEEYASRIRDDEETALNYKRWTVKDGPGFTMTSCDESCRMSIYCDVLNSYGPDESSCKGEQSLDGVHFDKY